MPRLLNDWLEAYLEFAKNTEPPLSYHTWVGVSVLASALQRRVHMLWGHTKIYPNQYIILVGPSGTARKGDAINMGRPMMEHVNIKIASQRITPEALISIMSESISSFIDTNKDLVYQAPISIIAGELSVFVGQKNLKLLADLTDLYDSHKSWEYQTKHGYQSLGSKNPGVKNKDIITGVCINLLAGTAPDWIPTIIPQEAIGGGWTSRVIFVVEPGKGQVVANPNLVPPDDKLRKKLEKDLEQIHLIIGQYTFTSKALDAYVDWYEDQEEALKAGIFPIQDGRFGGYVARRATHIKKLAMCLSAARDNEVEINLQDFERAKVLLERTEKKMASAFKGMGKSNIAELTDKVLTIIKAKKIVKRSEILKFLYGDIDLWTLEQVQALLYNMKVIDVIILNEERDVLYKYEG